MLGPAARQQKCHRPAAGHYVREELIIRAEVISLHKE